MTPPTSTSLPGVLGRLASRAAQMPHATVYTHLVDGEAETVDRSYGELWHRAGGIARALIERGLTGERVLLIHPPGLDYADAFFGCLLAGVIAVPDSPPTRRHPARSAARLKAVSSDARAAAVLTSSSLMGARDAMLPEVAGLPWLATDAVEPAAPTVAALDPEGLAYLQYTSGSTAEPKGVMLSHRNLAANCRAIEETYATAPDDIMVCWVPTFHDLGLLYGIAMPVWTGFRSVLMDSVHFVERPVRWLRAVDRFRGTLTVGPDTGYSLAASKVQPAECEGLDLSCLRMALTGGEPVRAATERRFRAVFAPFRLGRGALSHSFGLAEATAKVTGEREGCRGEFRRLDADALARGRAVDAAAGAAAVEAASCGTVAGCTRVVIVDPDTGEVVGPGQVGEIWVSSPSVGLGYWDRPALSEARFRARTAAGDGPFLRTGDLGFLDGERVFVTGRRKEVIIVGGRNHYPQDIEAALLGRHPALRPGALMAVGVPGPVDEAVAVVVELRSAEAPPFDEVVDVIRPIVGAMGLRVASVVFVPRGSIGRTISGKLQRVGTRQRLLAGALEAVHRWDAPAEGGAPADASTEEVVRALMHAVTGLPIAEIDLDAPLPALGMASLTAVALSNRLSGWLGRPVSMARVLGSSTLAALCRWIDRHREATVSADADAAVAAARAALSTAPDLPLTLGRWRVRGAEPADAEAMAAAGDAMYAWLGVRIPQSLMQANIAQLNSGPLPWVLALERDGEIVGNLVLQPTRIDPARYSTWAEACDGHLCATTFDPEGPNVYIVSGGTVPAVPREAFSLIVLRALQIMRALGRRTVFVSLAMPSFAERRARTGISAAELMDATDADGAPVDPFMALWRSEWPGRHRPFRLMPAGYPPDRMSAGHCVSGVTDLDDIDDAIERVIERLLGERDALGLIDAG